MVIGIAEDYSSTVLLDNELTAVSASGIYANQGVHPSINNFNLLSFLPLLNITFSAWDDETTYGKYADSNKRTDVVSKSGKIFQSIRTPNLNHDPEEVNSTYWLETNIESLRIKSFLSSVISRVYSELNLTKRLVNNQYLYENSERYRNTVTLPNDYAAWVFEPKGSDYVTFRINQISFTKLGTTPVNLYVINQGVLIDTLEITPSNGVLEFKDLNYTFKGKGRFIFAIDSTTVQSSLSYVDPLKYDGFVCYPASGVGSSPENANFNFFGVSGNGLGFNITVFLDASTYIENNINEFAGFVRATFEYMAFQMFLANSNNRSNRAQMIQMSDEMLISEVMNNQANTAFTRFEKQRKIAIEQLSKTFDTQLNTDTDDSLTIELGTY